MATNDLPSGFRTGKELLEAHRADAIRFCEDCEEFGPHYMNDDGSYECQREPCRTAGTSRDENADVGQRGDK